MLSRCLCLSHLYGSNRSGIVAGYSDLQLQTTVITQRGQACSERMVILYSPSINLLIVSNCSGRDIPFRYHESGAAMNAFYGCSIAKGRLNLLVRYWVPTINARRKPQGLEVVSCHEGTPASTFFVLLCPFQPEPTHVEISRAGTNSRMLRS